MARDDAPHNSGAAGGVLESQLGAALAGAIVGGLVTWRVTRQEEKRRRTLQFIEEYLKNQPKRAQANFIFNEMISGKKSPPWKNAIIEIGNWYEIVAMCYWEGVIDRNLATRSGIRAEIDQFYGQLKATFPDLAEHWTHIRDVAGMHRYP